jgi:hypothetical protein
MAYTKYSLTPADNNAAPPNGAPEGMLPSAVNDTMRDMMSQIRDVGDGIRGGTYTMTAPVITGGSITGVALTGNTFTSPVISGGSINNTPIGATTASTGRFSDLTDTGLTSGRVIYAGTGGNLVDDADFTFNGTTVTMANDASISGLTVGKGGGEVASATVVGNGAMNATNTGANNSAFGSSALRSNTSGANNTSVGLNAMYYNTSGDTNIAMGVSSLQNNTTGSSNVGLGYQALLSNTTASNNTAVGYQASYTATTATENSSLGYQAMYSTTTGSYNAAFGFSALKANSTGATNTAIGHRALQANTTASDNSAVGQNALGANTTGTNNTAVGSSALQANTTASGNTAVGYQAGYSSVTGGSNVFIGGQAGYSSVSTTSNAGNTIIGFQAGYSLTTGVANVFIGSNNGGSVSGSGAAITTGSKNTIIGSYNGNQGGLDIRTASNYIVLSDGDGNPRGYFNNDGVFTVGNTINAGSTTGTVGLGIWSNFGSRIVDFARYADDGAIVGFKRAGTLVGNISVTGSATSYNTSSDYRLKENIAPMQNALSVVQQLKPVTYNWKADGSDSQGFIAHELQAVVPDCVTGEKDAVDAEGNPVYQGIDTSFLVATLTAAIQELKAEVDTLKAQLENK